MVFDAKAVDGLEGLFQMGGVRIGHLISLISREAGQRDYLTAWKSTCRRRDGCISARVAIPPRAIHTNRGCSSSGPVQTIVNLYFRKSVGNPNYLPGNFLWGQDEIYEPAFNRTFWHIRLASGLRFLCQGYTPNFFDAAQCRSAIAIIARHYHRDNLAVPMFG
jgi:hypothetical protein